jgi:hypothetical protein
MGIATMRRVFTLSNSLLTTVRGLMLAGMAVGIVALVLAIMPTIRAQSAACASGPQEAENGVLTGFTVGADAAARGGGYIHVPDGAGSRWSPTTAYYAQYCFTVPSDGLYRLEAGVWADTTTNDSFFVAIDGAMQGEGRWDTRVNTSYMTDEANSYQVSDPLEVVLSAGDHIVDVYLREDGTRLDHLELVEVLAEDPPACTSGWVQAEKGVLSGFTVARNGKYIEIPESMGSVWSPKNDRRAVYCLEVSAAGSYRIEGRVHTPDYSSDSFFVRVDGGPAFTWYADGPGKFRDDYVNNWGVEDPAEVWLEPGTHLITIYGREAGTQLDRLRLRRDAASSCRTGRIEAEDADLTGFTTARDNAASGGQYVHVPDGDGSSWSPSESYEMEFCWDVSTAGTYSLSAGVWADAMTNDSFWVKVDGVVQGRWDTLLNTSYAQDHVGIRGGADPLVLSLSAGQHVIEILLREDGTRLDWLELEPSG